MYKVSLDVTQWFSLTSGTVVLVVFPSRGYVMARMLMEKLTRSMYDKKQAKNSMIATLKRVGILSAKWRNENGNYRSRLFDLM
jgi:hypothetical protein